MPTCVAINCNKKRLKGCKVSFHLFPFSKPALLQQWVVAVRRENWAPSKLSSLCAAHFTEESFDRTGQTVRLRAGAIPSIFAFQDHLLKTKSTRKKGQPQAIAPAKHEAVAVESSLGPSTGSVAEHRYQESPNTEAESPAIVLVKQEVIPDESLSPSPSSNQYLDRCYHESPSTQFEPPAIVLVKQEVGADESSSPSPSSSRFLDRCYHESPSTEIESPAIVLVKQEVIPDQSSPSASIDDQLSWTTIDCGPWSMDHHYHESPRKVKSLDEVIFESDVLKKKLKVSQQRIRRLKKKVTSLTNVVKNLREELKKERCS